MPSRFAVLVASVVAALATAPAASADLFTFDRNLPAGGSARAVEVGDFNDDGDPDLAVANFGGSRVFMGGAGNGFSAGDMVAGDASGVAVADFNGDGDDDVAFASASLGVLTALRDDNGGFAALAPAAFGTLVWLAVGDFNGDGDPDLAAANQAAGQNGVATLLGGTGGTFLLPGTNFSTPQFPQQVVVADFDRDGDDDVAATTLPAGVSVLLNTGSGFAPSVEYAAGTSATGLATGDFDGDGFPDLAIASFISGNVTIRAGGPGGTFGPATTHPVGAGPSGIAVGDFNGDDDPDLAVGNFNGNSVSVLVGRAGVDFAPAQSDPVGDRPTDVAVADLDGDGRQDLAVANASSNNLTLLRNTAAPAIETDPSGLNFAPQAQATISAPRTITVHSTGDRVLRVQRLRKIGPARDDYLITTDTCTGTTIAPGGSCTLVVRFAPEAAGPREANLQIDSDAPIVPIYDLPLNGTGGALPTGPAGPAGPAGPPGSDGTVGASGTARALLAAVFAADRQSARAGRQVRVRYVSTVDALVTVELRRGTRVVRRFTATAVAGRNTLAFRAPARGRYTLALAAVAGDQRVTDAARLTVLRRRA